MVDSPTSIVLLSSNGNSVGSTVRCRRTLWKSTSARIGALIGKMTLLTTGIAVPISGRLVLPSLGPPNTLIPSRSLEIVGALNDLMLQCKKPLSS
jgi:hypothetical protein